MAHAIGKLDPVTREALEVLGAVLRELRVTRGLSQRTLAGRCGLSQSTISRLERGLAEGTRVAWIARLLAGLDDEVRSLPDHRPIVERHHGFRKLRDAFRTSEAAARRSERERRRRESIDAIFEGVRQDRDREAAEAQFPD